MAVEIERKFLVKKSFYAEFIAKKGEGTSLVQGYLAASTQSSVRIRCSKRPNEESKAIMTVKFAQDDQRRDEYEHEMPVDQAMALIFGHNLPRLVKTRLRVPHGPGQDLWEVDLVQLSDVVLPGEEPAYLIVAEIEQAHTQSPIDQVALPEWIEREVTGDPVFIMANMTTSSQRRAAYIKAYGW